MNRSGTAMGSCLCASAVVNRQYRLHCNKDCHKATNCSFNIEVLYYFSEMSQNGQLLHACVIELIFFFRNSANFDVSVCLADMA